jgi:hypothetical protein
MSESSAFGFGQFVPGFDFLQNLSKTAAQAAPAAGAVPGMASWVAPTLSVEELDKRIQELKAVQFWLDQNATALKATIQAMEVQKMTLSTLQSMNVNMADLAKAFTVKAPVSEAPSAAEPEEKTRTSIFSPKPKTSPQPEPVAEPETGPVDAQAGESQNEEPTESEAQPKAASDKPAVDPMQWWGALTQQFQGIAAAAMKDVAGEAMKAGMAAQSAAKAGTAARTASAKAQSKPKTKSSPRASGAAATQPAAKKVVKKVAKSVQAAHKSAAKTTAQSAAQTARKTASRSSRPATPKRAAK